MTTGEDDLSIFDDMAFGDHEGDEHDEDDDEGLELDESQSVEIRKIFLITLPQYLEPVEQMIDVLMQPGSSDEATFQTLATTLASISAAADRVGITDVLNEIDNMRGLLHELQDADESEREATEQALLQSLAAIQAISESAGGASRAPDGDEARETIFSALHGVPGVDPAALKKLTAAGLVNLEQLRIARPDEVVAVTGLSEDVVDAILKAVGSVHAPEPSTPKRSAEIPAPPKQRPVIRVKPKDDDARVNLLSRSADDDAQTSDLKDELEQSLRRQIDSETSLDELRVLAQRKRQEAVSLRQELEELRLHRDALQAALEPLLPKNVEALEVLSDLRDRNQALNQQFDLTSRTYERRREQLATLERRHDELARIRDQELSQLVDLRARLERMLDASDPRRSLRRGRGSSPSPTLQGLRKPGPRESDAPIMAACDESDRSIEEG